MMTDDKRYRISRKARTPDPASAIERSEYWPRLNR